MARRVITNFRASDFSRDGAKPATRERTEDELAAEAAQADTDVPEGTTNEIMAWVGDSTERAKNALDAENENDTPRKTLVSQLEKMTAEDKTE